MQYQCSRKQHFIMSTMIVTSSSATLFPLCRRCRQMESLTCKLVVLYKRLSDILKRIFAHIISARKRQGQSSTLSSSKFNIFSIALLLFVFVSIVPASRADYLCGSRLVDALRYICGSRGIYNPTHHNRYRGSSRRHQNTQPQMSITHLCCEIGCTMTQLNSYCAPRRQRLPQRHHRYQNHNFPTPPAFVAPPTKSLYERITTQSRPTEPTALTSTVASTTVKSIHAGHKKIRPSLKELEKRYKSLLHEDEHDRVSAAGASRRNRTPEIIRLAAEISRRMERQKPQIVSPHDGHIKAMLVLEPET